MWHRLPYEQKVRPRGRSRAVRSAASRRRRAARAHPGRARDARRRPRARSRSRGTTSCPRTSSTCRRSRSTRDSVTNRDYLEFVEAGGYRDEALWDAEGWQWRSAHDVRHPLFWELHRGRLVLARHVGASPAAAGVARLRRRTRRRRRTRAGRAGACRPRPSSTAPPSERPRAASGAHPWGDEAPDATRGNFDFARWRSGAGRLLPARRRAPGASTISSATDGSGRRRSSPASRASRRWPSYPAVLGGLLRREALRHEGRLARDGAGARAAQLPQLVPAGTIRTSTRSSGRRDIVSIPLDRPASARRGGPRLRGRRPPRPRAVAEAAPVEVPLRRARLGALRGDLPAAVVPDHARRGPAARRGSRRRWWLRSAIR